MSFTRSSSVALFLVLSVVVIASDAIAQMGGAGLAQPMQIGSAASYYYVAKAGELTMQINVWGYVRNPGRYEVTTSTDIIQLLSYAGGPIQDAKMDEVKVTRFLKRETGISRGEFFVNLEDLSHVDQAKLILYPGDTIYVDHTGLVAFRDIVSFVTAAAVVTAAVAQVLYVSYVRK